MKGNKNIYKYFEVKTEITDGRKYLELRFLTSNYSNEWK